MANNFSLRPANAEDAFQIEAFVRQEGLNRFGLDWQRFTMAVAENGRPVGCVQYKPHGQGVMELASLVVAADWRGKGAGKALVAHLQQAQGPPLWLMCAGRTAGFYRPLGFVVVARSKEMPPYFQRIYRLFSLFGWLLRPENRLTIMVWPSPG